MSINLQDYVDVLQLAVNGIPIALLTILIVQGLKQAGLVDDEIEKKRAPIITALVLSALWAPIQVQGSPITYEVIIGAVFQALAGGLFAGLGYTRIVKPVFNLGEGEEPVEE